MYFAKYCISDYGSCSEVCQKTLQHKVVIIKVCCCSVVGTVRKLDWIFFGNSFQNRRILKELLNKQVDTNKLLKLDSQTLHNITLHFVAKILKNFFWNFSQKNQWFICYIYQWRNLCFVWCKNLLLKSTFFRLMTQQNWAQS